MSDSPVLFTELEAESGVIGQATLNLPGSLNSLNLEMIDLLQKQLDQWESDERIAAIFIDATGEKAFCAGGDVLELHRSSVENPGGPCEYAETFFAREYRLNYTLYNYPKPIICWGNGIVMGGGLGVFVGCSHRVVTESTRIAMPEITIALFPDVGGTWFLNRMPGKIGLFLALTASSINATDALYTGIADRVIESGHKEAVIEELEQQSFTDELVENQNLIAKVLRKYSGHSSAAVISSPVTDNHAAIDKICDNHDIHQVIDNIIELKDGNNAWLAKAGAGLSGGSMLAALWTHRQLRSSRYKSLAEVFQSELQLGTNIMRHPEFAEGVRALLIDKDRKPSWSYKQSRDVPTDVLDGFFTPPWETNPLADLGRD